jgi:hypothetical protein
LFVVGHEVIVEVYLHLCFTSTLDGVEWSP